MMILVSFILGTLSFILLQLVDIVKLLREIKDKL